MKGRGKKGRENEGKEIRIAFFLQATTIVEVHFNTLKLLSQLDKMLLTLSCSSSCTVIHLHKRHECFHIPDKRQIKYVTSKRKKDEY